jgi:hypothetical protein
MNLKDPIESPIEFKAFLQVRLLPAPQAAAALTT